jgi:diacylglycerol kinase (ATP)
LPGCVWQRVYLGKCIAEMVMNARHILYIINPISGTRPKQVVREIIEKQTSAQDIPFQVFPSVASGDYSFLRPIIREKKITDIVIAGGDGTIRQVIDNLGDLDLPFGIIPCGSGNGLAFTAGIPKKPEAALKIIFKGKVLKTDGFYINDQFACMLCGLGFDAKVAHDFARQPKRGYSTYVKQVIRNFFTARTYPFEIKLDGRKIRTEAFFISIANSNQFGNNFTIAPQASLVDGLLDIVIMGKQNKIGVLINTFLQVGGRNKMIRGNIPDLDAAMQKHAGVIYFQAERLTISNPEKAPLHIDGDPVEAVEKLDISVRKKYFRLIQPG